jgi:hypothetical protein
VALKLIYMFLTKNWKYQNILNVFANTIGFFSSYLYAQFRRNGDWGERRFKGVAATQMRELLLEGDNTVRGRGYSKGRAVTQGGDRLLKGDSGYSREIAVTPGEERLLKGGEQSGFSRMRAATHTEEQKLKGKSCFSRRRAASQDGERLLKEESGFSRRRAATQGGRRL